MATRHVAVRLDDETLARVDALISALSTAWRPAKRSDVLRALINAGLAAQARGGAEWPAEGRRSRRARRPRPEAGDAEPRNPERI